MRNPAPQMSYGSAAPRPAAASLWIAGCRPSAGAPPPPLSKRRPPSSSAALGAPGRDARAARHGQPVIVRSRRAFGGRRCKSAEPPEIH
eukprot:gene17895-biopygen3891